MTDEPRSSDQHGTPEGHTQEKPAADEHGQPGTPADDDHGHTEPRLGPIDWPAWGYAIAGVAVAMLVIALMWSKVSALITGT